MRLEDSWNINLTPAADDVSRDQVATWIEIITDELIPTHGPADGWRIELTHSGNRDDAAVALTAGAVDAVVDWYVGGRVDRFEFWSPSGFVTFGATAIGHYLPKPELGHLFGVSAAKEKGNLSLDQEAWVRMFIDSTEVFGEAVGGLAEDRHGSWETTALGVATNLPYFGLPNRHTQLRGYEWANVLLASHVEALGGLERVRAEAPVRLVRELANGMVYLQLTDQIGDMGYGRVVGYREYLGCVLPEHEPKYRSYGPRHLAFSEPPPDAAP